MHTEVWVSQSSRISPTWDTISVQELLVHIIASFVSLYGPVLMLLEDVHHFDTVSLQLLGILAGALPEGLMLIASKRPPSLVKSDDSNKQVAPRLSPKNSRR